MKIKVKDHQLIAKVKPALVRNLLERALELEGRIKGELSILLVDDRTMRELNRRYRGTDEATDVLAFSQREGAYPEINPDLLGDIVVSVERASVQSKRFGQTLEKELSLYLIHGLLHLLGYDDVSPSDRTRMEKRQQELLRKILL